MKSEFLLISAAALMFGFTTAPTSAATFAFNGNSGNTGAPSPAVYDFGTIVAGSSTFATTNNDYIPFPGGSNHGGNNLYTFALSSTSTVSFTFTPGQLTVIELLGLNYSRFSNPLYNGCCELAYSNNGNNNPDPSAPVTLTESLSAGDYELGVSYLIPAAPIGTAPYYSESYSGSILLTPSGAVPEPSTWAMFLVGFGTLGFMMRGSRRMGAALTV